MTRASAYALGYKIVYQFEPTELCPTVESLEGVHKRCTPDFPDEESPYRFAYLTGKRDGFEAKETYRTALLTFEKLDEAQVAT